MRLCDRLQKLPSEIMNESEEWVDYFSVLTNADNKRAKFEKKSNKNKASKY